MTLRRLIAEAWRRGLIEDDSDEEENESWAELTEWVRQRVLDDAVAEQRAFILDRSQ